MSNYGILAAEPSYNEPKRRKSFKERLRDYLTRSINKKDALVTYRLTREGEKPVGMYKFNNNFEGWQIRMHKAHEGHVVEAWRSVDTPYNTNIGKTDHQHILFLVNSSEDMGKRLNDIMVELALRM